MTDPTFSRRSVRDSLDTATLPAVADGAATRPRSAPRWLLPAAAAVLTVLGAGALVAAALTPSGEVAAPTPGQSASDAPAPATAAPSPAVSGTPAADARDTPISELADPAWVSRIARAGDIPERALAAYAGAALAVAETNPTCQIGWNTLAAIGQVESEHATMNGAHLDDRGVATPTLVGIALDGTGDTAKVPDTDGGQYDGDTTWDHAVGPMQFLPATWAQAAQDGNEDGAKDINQIDDAALAAAVHLCQVDGDLTVPDHWIAAISAYNPAVDYNHRVAQAATAYAALS